MTAVEIREPRNGKTGGNFLVFVKNGATGSPLRRPAVAPKQLKTRRPLDRLVQSGPPSALGLAVNAKTTAPCRDSPD